MHDLCTRCVLGLVSCLLGVRGGREAGASGLPLLLRQELNGHNVT